MALEVKSQSFSKFTGIKFYSLKMRSGVLVLLLDVFIRTTNPPIDIYRPTVRMCM